MRRAFVTLASSILVGVLAGVLWSRWADAGQWLAREDGLILTQNESRGVFAAVVLFTLIGFVSGWLGGVALGLAFRSLGALVVPLAVLWSGAASVLAWRIGERLGPPDPATVSGLAPGDLVPAALDINTWAPFIAWPMGAVFGILLVAWIPGRSAHPGSHRAMDAQLHGHVWDGSVEHQPSHRSDG